MATVEILKANRLSNSMRPVIEGLERAARDAGDSVTVSKHYQGKSDWLVLAGVGWPEHHQARNLQIARKGRTLHWDHGYFDREKVTGYMRMCIDTDHPVKWLDKTEPDPSRWLQHGIELREDASVDGHIVLAGMGHKSRKHLGLTRWEEGAYDSLLQRFPWRRIVYRQKGGDPKRVGHRIDPHARIEDSLRGAYLVVCRHSNVAVDAVIAGVPFEAVDGAAAWLNGKPYTVENRLDFLYRASWWQWRATEVAEAWAFAKRIAT